MYMTSLLFLVNKLPVANRSSQTVTLMPCHLLRYVSVCVCEQSVLCSTSSVFLAMTTPVATNFNFLPRADIRIIAIIALYSCLLQCAGHQEWAPLLHTLHSIHDCNS